MENFNEQREIVIRPKSIKIENSTLPENICRSETSPFEDGYDYYAEAERLGSLNDAEKFLHQADFDLLAEREARLKDIIYRKDYFTRLMMISADDIDLSEIVILPQRSMVGRLRNIGQPDSIFVHSRYSTNMWFGFVNHDQKHIGLFSAARNLSILSRLANRDHFYAQSILVTAEKELNALHQLVGNQIAHYNKIIDEYGKNGIQVRIFESEKPRRIEVMMNKYVGSVVLLLTQYDRLSRIVVTLQEKGLLANNNNLQSVTQTIRQFCEKLFESTEPIANIENLTRRSLLENNPDGIVQKISNAIAEELLPPIPLNVLLMEDLPKIMNIQKTLTDEEIEQLKQIAIENKLVSEV